MNDAGGVLRIAVLGDSSATLYSQEDPHETLRELGARSWPELLGEAASGGHVEVLSLAGVGQQLSQGLAKRYAQLADFRPDVLLISHGGREGVVALPRALAWLRCYAHDEAPYKGDRRWSHALRRPIWRALVALVDRAPRLAQWVLWPAHIRAVQNDTAAYRVQLEDTVRWAVEDLRAHVVLVTTNISHQSFWPVFSHILATNDASARAIAASRPGEVSVFELRPHMTRPDFAADGAHLNPSGHIRAAGVIWQHIETSALTLDRVPAHSRKTHVSVA